MPNLGAQTKTMFLYDPWLSNGKFPPETMLTQGTEPGFYS